MAASTVEELLAEYPPWVQEKAEQLREFVKSCMPTATEKVYSGWKAIGFQHPHAGYVCGIFLGEENVRLYFEYGSILSDPYGLLQGETKQVRWIEIKKLTKTLRRRIASLIDEAIVLRSPHGLRRF